MSAAETLDDWRQAADGLDIRNKAFINGKFVDAASGATYASINPADGSEIASIASCDEEDVDRAVKAAREAFESGVWSQMAPARRKRVLQKFAQKMRDNREELALLETLDVGKPIRDTTRIDIPASAASIDWFAELVDKVYDEIAPSDPAFLGMITREPLGVVGIIVPWNFPLLMASWKLGPALAAGNSVILKPASVSSLTALRVAELAAEAGIPDGVFNVVTGSGTKVGMTMGLHMDIDGIGFTGSTEVGKQLMQYAGQSNLKRLGLELGGKSPNIVLADSPDLDYAAKAACFGIFFNQGEICNAGSRLLVQDSIKDEFMELVTKNATRHVPGEPLDPGTRMGAIVDQSQMDKVLYYIDEGRSAGANLLYGGSRVREDTGGYYVEPTIFDRVSNDMKIAQEEIFGPVLSVITFKDVDEAISIANDTIYGLASAVWTSNLATAHKTARTIKAGTVWINNYDQADMTVPFGGYKQSGFGRDKSIHALDKFTQLKTTWINLAV
ncbi:MAG: aldehyde dehydrogenase [Alphaproteobacteria bacterium]|nr:aldehyde dehydrogenase [Alphaproteobacteria bacterium]